jgi:hypothetical protein
MNQTEQYLRNEVARLTADLAEARVMRDEYLCAKTDLLRVRDALVAALRDLLGEMDMVATACALSGMPPKVWAGRGSKARAALKLAGEE